MYERVGSLSYTLRQPGKKLLVKISCAGWRGTVAYRPATLPSSYQTRMGEEASHVRRRQSDSTLSHQHLDMQSPHRAGRSGPSLSVRDLPADRPSMRCPGMMSSDQETDTECAPWEDSSVVETYHRRVLRRSWQTGYLTTCQE